MKTLLVGLKTLGEFKPPMNVDVGMPPTEIFINVAEISTIICFNDTMCLLEMKSGKVYLMPYSADDLASMLSSLEIDDEYLAPNFPVIKFEYYGEGFDSDIGEQRL